MNSRVLLLFILASALAGHTSAASLTLLPDWFGDKSMRSLWMMPDGETFTGVDGDDVFRWSMASGRTSIGTLPSTFSDLPVRATAVSDDGSTIIGYLGGHRSFSPGGFMWRVGEGVVAVPSSAEGSNLRTIPMAVSRDGSVIVGSEYLRTDPWDQFEFSSAFRWTIDTGTVPLEGLRHAEAISDDGTVVVGSKSFGEGGVQAARWTDATGSIGLGVLPNSWQQVTSSKFVSTDGNTIVGHGFPPDAQIGPKVFRWTEASGMQQLSTLGADQTVVAISDDANFIIGVMRTRIPDAQDGTGEELFVWTPDIGLRTAPQLQSIFDSGSSREATRILSISGDGRTAFGDTIYLGAGWIEILRREYWLLDLSPVPEPSSLTLSSLAMLLIVCGRLRDSVPLRRSLRQRERHQVIARLRLQLARAVSGDDHILPAIGPVGAQRCVVAGPDLHP